MARVRLGLIGCGHMARQHAGGFNRLSDRLSLTAAVDKYEERAETVAADFEGRRAFTDYEEILDEVDAF